MRFIFTGLFLLSALSIAHEGVEKEIDENQNGTPTAAPWTVPYEPATPVPDPIPPAEYWQSVLDQYCATEGRDSRDDWYPTREAALAALMKLAGDTPIKNGRYVDLTVPGCLPSSATIE